MGGRPALGRQLASGVLAARAPRPSTSPGLEGAPLSPDVHEALTDLAWYVTEREV